MSAGAFALYVDVQAGSGGGGGGGGGAGASIDRIVPLFPVVGQSGHGMHVGQAYRWLGIAERSCPQQTGSHTVPSAQPCVP